MIPLILRDLRRGYASGGVVLLATHQPIALPDAQGLALPPTTPITPASTPAKAGAQ